MLERISDRHDHGKTTGEAMTLPAKAGAGTAPVALDAPKSTDDTTNRKNMALLIQLRWTAVIGQIATIAIVDQWLGIALPILPMAGVIAALVALNLLSLVWVRYRAEINNRELLLALMLDVAALTGQLYLSGGATNPFTSLYLLQVTLGAVLLDARSTWSLVAFAFLSFAGLTVAYRPLGAPHHGFSDPFSLHVAGMFIGFMLDAILLVVFVTRIHRNLRERDANLAALRQHAAEQDHIVRMGLLASGAAHELGTPLASLSVIVSDWRRMPALTSDSELSDDLAEMETSLQRCKSIVTGILVSAGEARGEESSPTTVTAFLAALVEEWRTTRPSATLYFRNDFGADLPVVSEVALKQAIFNVLDNSAEVSRDWIELAAERAGEKLVLSVTDRGPGFAPEMLAQLGKPYQSSKGRPGSGLGLFLVVNVVRKLGGIVTARNNAEGGATISLELPLATLAIGGGLDE
jgi:two-component system, sensor histidine kinase RegB